MNYIFLFFCDFLRAGGSSCDQSTWVSPRLILLLRRGAEPPVDSPKIQGFRQQKTLWICCELEYLRIGIQVKRNPLYSSLFQRFKIEKIGIQQKIRLQPARNWGMNMSEEGGFKKKIGSLRLHQSKILVSGIFWDLNNKHGVLNHPNWGRIESNIWVSNKPTYWFNDWICRMEMPFNFLTKQMTRWTNEKWGEWGQNSDRMVDIGVQFYKLLLVRSWPVNIINIHGIPKIQSLLCHLVLSCLTPWIFWADTVGPSQYYPILDAGTTRFYS